MTQHVQDPTVRLTRILAAPPARVYRAWLDPAVIREWFSPDAFTVSDVVVEERVGGRHAVHYGDSGGFESRLLELVPDRRLVLAWGFVGPDRVYDPAHESRLTIELRPVGEDETELTLTHERLDRLAALLPEVADGVSTGWSQALGKLAVALHDSSLDAGRGAS